MPKKRAFISFDFDNDKTCKDFIIGQSMLPDSPFEAADWSSAPSLTIPRKNPSTPTARSPPSRMPAVRETPGIRAASFRVQPAP